MKLNVPDSKPEGATDVNAAKLLRTSLQRLNQEVPGWVEELADGRVEPTESISETP